MQEIAAGMEHTVCCSVDGDVYAFGSDEFGQLGVQANTILPLRVRVSKKAKIISCGASHTAMLTDEGEVLCWGWNKYGQLGLNDTTDRSHPTQVALGDYSPRNLACGWFHTLVLADAPASS